MRTGLQRLERHLLWDDDYDSDGKVLGKSYRQHNLQGDGSEDEDLSNRFLFAKGQQYVSILGETYA